MKLLVILLAFLFSSLAVATSGDSELYVAGSVHQSNPSYDSTDLVSIITKLQPDVILTEGDASLFDEEGKVSERAEGLEVEAYRVIQARSDIEIINISMPERNKKMVELEYNETLGSVFKLLQESYSQKTLKASEQFEQVLQTFPARSECLNSSSFSEMQSTKCRDAISKNSNAIFMSVGKILAAQATLTTEAKKWETIAVFHQERQTAIVENTINIVTSESNKRYLLILGLMHFSDVYEKLKKSEIDIKVRLVGSSKNGNYGN